MNAHSMCALNAPTVAAAQAHHQRQRGCCIALHSSATDNTLRQMARLYMRVSRDKATLAGHRASAMATMKLAPA